LHNSFLDLPPSHLFFLRLKFLLPPFGQHFKAHYPIIIWAISPSINLKVPKGEDWKPYNLRYPGVFEGFGKDIPKIF